MYNSDSFDRLMSPFHLEHQYWPPSCLNAKWSQKLSKYEEMRKESSASAIYQSSQSLMGKSVAESLEETTDFADWRSIERQNRHTFTGVAGRRWRCRFFQMSFWAEGNMYANPIKMGMPCGVLPFRNDDGWRWSRSRMRRAQAALNWTLNFR